MTARRAGAGSAKLTRTETSGAGTDRKTVDAIGNAARLIAKHAGLSREELSQMLEGIVRAARDERDTEAFLEAVRSGGTPLLALRLSVYGDLSDLPADVDASTVHRKQRDASRLPAEDRRTIQQGFADPDCEVSAGRLAECPLGGVNWRLCPHAI